MGKKGKSKTPLLTSALPDTPKNLPPRWLPSTSLDDRYVVVRFEIIDTDGKWCPSGAESADIKELFQKVRSLSTMTMHELFGGGPGKGSRGKDYNTAELPNPDARARLSELELDDQARISCIRLTGARRLYGFRHENYFYALWYDPLHEIWPSKK